MYFDKQKEVSMTHWGWYWKVKRQHTPKRLCSWYYTLDSFSLFKIKESFEWCLNRVALEIPRYKLKATLLIDRYSVEYDCGKYDILIEKQPCNYGGIRYFLHCPVCTRRMRILYCHGGFFCCRKCLKLGYFSQRLVAYMRFSFRANDIEKYLEARGGTLYKKPPRMHKITFEDLRDAHWKYEEKSNEAIEKECLSMRRNKREEAFWRD